MSARILVTTDVYPPDCGGSGWSTDALVRTLRDRGHGVEVVEIDGGSTRETTREYEGVTVRVLGIAASRTRWSRLGSREYSHEPVRDWVRSRLRAEPRIDLVHAQHLHSGPGALEAARESGRGAVLTVRDHWPVCLHGLVWWGGSSCTGCTAGNLIGCMHEYYGLRRPVAAAMIPWARRRLAARGSAPGLAHRVVVPSRTLAGRLQDRLGALPIDVVPNIVDPARSDRLADRAEPRTLPDRFLLAAGKLNEGKGFGELLAALVAAGSRLPLVIAGEGPLRTVLQESAAAAGLELHLTGWVDAPQLLALMRAAEALLLPSRVEEALARTLLESLSVGTPVVSWPIGSSREVIEEGVNGWVVDTPEALGAAIRALEAPDTRIAMRDAAERTARERFSPEAVYPDLLGVYDAALAEAGR